MFENGAGKPLDLGLYSQRVLCGETGENKFGKLGLTWRGFHSGRRSAVTEMRNHGKPEDVARHFGHSVQVADDLYDKGRIEATKAAANGWLLRGFVLCAKEGKSIRRGQERTLGVMITAKPLKIWWPWSDSNSRPPV